MASSDSADIVPSTILSLYQKLGAISSQMLLRAREENWDELAGSEQERVKLIEILRSAQIDQISDPQIIAAIDGLIHFILAIDQEIIQITGSRLKEIKSDLDSIHASKKLSTAYGA